MNDGSFFFVTVGDDLSVYIAYIEVLFIPETCRFIFFGACTKSKLFGGDIVESIVFRFNVFAIICAIDLVHKDAGRRTVGDDMMHLEKHVVMILAGI